MENLYNSINQIMSKVLVEQKFFKRELKNYSTPLDGLQDFLQEKEDNNELTKEEREILDFINLIIKP